MYQQWMPLLRLPLSEEQFQQLPRNLAYHYEYINGEAFLTPDTRTCHALLDLETVAMKLPDQHQLVRPMRDEDFIELIGPFAAAFRDTQPYAGVAPDARPEAARHALERVRLGGDGPWIQQASFVAMQNEQSIGAILITLLPPGDPDDLEHLHWQEEPPADCILHREGRPHLTWIFVTPLQSQQGIGTLLLAAASQGLRSLGYEQLLSTILLGNDASILWHWRNGFRLLGNPYSPSRLRKLSI